MSVINGASMIRDAIARKFSIDHEALDLFTIWPKYRYTDGPAKRAKYSEHSRSGWRNVTRQEIEAEVGDLSPLPDHEVLFSKVLARGGQVRESSREVFEAVFVTSLPPPHQPYQCMYYARFRKLLGKSDSHEAHLAAGAQFLTTLTSADLKGCSYHQDGWTSIADASAQIIDRLAGMDDPDYVSAAEGWHLPAKDHSWLVSLFRDPILLRGDRTSYTNGQHRGCALRFSGQKERLLS